MVAVRHLSDSEIGDDPMGGVGATDSDMVALLQTEGGEQLRYAADLRVHLAIGIVITTGGVLGGTVLRQIEVREGGLIPVLIDGFCQSI